MTRTIFLLAATYMRDKGYVSAYRFTGKEHTAQILLGNSWITFDGDGHFSSPFRDGFDNAFKLGRLTKVTALQLPTPLGAYGTDDLSEAVVLSKQNNLYWVQSVKLDRCGALTANKAYIFGRRKTADTMLTEKAGALKGEAVKLALDEHSDVYTALAQVRETKLQAALAGSASNLSNDSFATRMRARRVKGV